ncbi:hypothetical protein [Pseudoxanthomonas winnipegensis]|uniref:Uncharacterized protein n=1 Tax=Pseudoxanthomonas winnipegensis TaxID=2480810 RepID=A0A4Q8L4R5_9GAMM|nr:hypothetical protein [Pseudoxanthomonas winnipegensis]TAA20346.1 hypothetical protein EA660_18330 [Pseudoxanthomonas winnipegensis]
MAEFFAPLLITAASSRTGHVSGHVVSDTTFALVQMLIQRDQAGQAKYGTTLDRTDLTRDEWLQHLIEELLDGAGYALRAKQTGGDG